LRPPTHHATLPEFLFSSDRDGNGGGGAPIIRGVVERTDARILVVEDELKVGQALSQALHADGHDVTMALTGDEGFALVSAREFELVLLDWMLPGRSGIEVLAALRRRATKTPVLMITARDALEDRIAGLDAGADDYLVKPFALAELCARVRALLRRGKADPRTVLRAGDLELDRIARSVVRGGREVELTVREYELLECLLLHHGRHVSREMLARDVWKLSRRDATLDNVIDVYVARLRRKVDPEPSRRLLHTVRGVGFVVREART
jgi:DNA-binding response OmpR family regulator